MADKIQTEDGYYGELQVLQSNAGYYIGRIFYNKDGFQEPGSRESDYFSTKKGAEEALIVGFVWRDCPENQFLYEENIDEVK